MPEHKVYILSTRPVNKTAVEKALKKHIYIDVLSFIETAPLMDIEVQQEVESISIEEAVVVFTSMNAVDAVTQMLDGFVPEWSIYCMGYKTKQLVSGYFGEHSIAGTGDHADELADIILENEVTDEINFFCGNLRREELPSKLRKHNIDVNEIVVYETTAVPHKIQKEYDAVLFFSPSAVESFFSNNKAMAKTIVFAIGQTTAQTIQKYCSNTIIISKEPEKDELVQQAVDYFSARV